MNGATSREPDPICLVMVGARWLIGSCYDATGGRVSIKNPCEYQGVVQMARSATTKGGVDVGVQRAVAPVAALVSLRELTVAPNAVVNLSELAPREQREIKDHYGRCLELLTTMRRELSTAAAPRLIMPGTE